MDFQGANQPKILGLQTSSIFDKTEAKLLVCCTFLIFSLVFGRCSLVLFEGGVCVVVVDSHYCYYKVIICSLGERERERESQRELERVWRDFTSKEDLKNHHRT